MTHIERLEPRMLMAASAKFAVIGDYGQDPAPERQVAKLVQGWKPDFVITVGDNTYSGPTSIDDSVGRFYHSYIAPYTGKYGAGSPGSVNRFFPAMGNHDWDVGMPTLQRYFKLPGNGRYYTFIRGPVQFFAVDSDPREPALDYVNGKLTTARSREGTWLKKTMMASKAKWKIVYFHHAPYSSGKMHGSSVWMQWPFKTWGATAVLSGHEHDYERVMRDGLPYIVDGSAGDDIRRGFRQPVVPGSVIRDDRDHGAMLVEANSSRISFRFFNAQGRIIDRYTIRAAGTAAAGAAKPARQNAAPAVERSEPVTP